MTQSLTFYGEEAHEYTGVNYHHDFRGRPRGSERFHRDGLDEVAVGPFGVQDLRWDGRVTHRAVYTSNPVWATVLGDEIYAKNIASGGRRALFETLYDALDRPYHTRQYTVAEAGDNPGSAGDYFQSNVFYDRNSRPVAQAQTHGAATETAYDGLGRAYQRRSVAKLEGEDGGGYYSGAVFQYQSPVPHPDFSEMAGGNNGVYALTHFEFTDSTDSGTETGLPTRPLQRGPERRQHGRGHGGGGLYQRRRLRRDVRVHVLRRRGPAGRVDRSRVGHEYMGLRRRASLPPAWQQPSGVCRH